MKYSNVTSVVCRPKSNPSPNLSPQHTEGAVETECRLFRDQEAITTIDTHMFEVHEELGASDYNTTFIGGKVIVEDDEGLTCRTDAKIGDFECY